MITCDRNNPVPSTLVFGKCVRHSALKGTNPWQEPTKQKLEMREIMTLKCVGFWELEGWQVKKTEAQNVALPGPLAPWTLCGRSEQCAWPEAALSSVQFSRSVVSDSLQPHELQHARPPCPSPTPGVYSNPRPLSRWCHPTISSSVVPFSSCPQSPPASGSFPMSQLFA